MNSASKAKEDPCTHLLNTHEVLAAWKTLWDRERDLVFSFESVPTNQTWREKITGVRDLLVEGNVS